MNELEELMAKVQEDHSLQGAFCAKFLSSPIFVINAGEDSHPHGESTLKEETVLQLVEGQLEDGRQFLPVFTSEEQLSRFIEQEMPYFALAGIDLLKLVAGGNVYINPASDCGILWTPDDIAGILDYFVGKEITVEEETEVLLGSPSADVSDLKAAMAAVFAKEDAVTSAYLALMVKGADMSLVVGIVTEAPAHAKAVFDRAGAAAKPHMPENHFLDFIVIDDPGDDGVQGFLLKAGDQFYVRQRN